MFSVNYTLGIVYSNQFREVEHRIVNMKRNVREYSFVHITCFLFHCVLRLQNPMQEYFCDGLLPRSTEGRTPKGTTENVLFALNIIIPPIFAHL